MKRPKLKVGTRDFLKTLLEQSQYFFETAEKAPIKSQPLLYYYSFLNLAKIVIAIKNGFDETSNYHHDIDTNVIPATVFSNAEITIKHMSLAKISVAKFFCEAMGDTFLSYPMKMKVTDCMKSCVAIHRTYCEIFNEQEMYYRLEDILLEKHGKVLTYKAKVRRCDSRIQGLLNAVGYNIVKEENGYYFSESYAMPNYNVSRNCYYTLSQQLRQKGLWYYISDDVFRTYISTKNRNRYSMETMIYCTMFFFGSITRYQPYFFDSILDNEQRWMVSEFMNTLPKQFIYLVTSKATGITIQKSRTAIL